MLCIDNVWIPLQLMAKLWRILVSANKKVLLESSSFYMQNSSHSLGHQDRLRKSKDKNSLNWFLGQLPDSKKPIHC
jgi:hypothetical protein